MRIILDLTLLHRMPMVWIEGRNSPLTAVTAVQFSGPHQSPPCPVIRASAALQKAATMGVFFVLAPAASFLRELEMSSPGSRNKESPASMTDTGLS